MNFTGGNLAVSVTREKLYDEIWTEPITKVSKRYGVSDSYLIRILKNLNIPRPPRGYWAMADAGIFANRPSLPPAKQGDPITWSRDGSTVFETIAINEEKPARTKRKQRKATHGLIREAYEYFRNVRDTDNPYLKPFKRLTIDLIVSQITFERGINVANQLYLLLEDAGYHVRIASRDQRIHRAQVEERENTKTNRQYSDLWQPDRPTIVYIQDLIVGLTIFEISEVAEVGYLNGKYIPIATYLKDPLIKQKSTFTWTTSQHMPSGRLCIQAYSTYPGAKWRKQWRESKPGDFTKSLKSIVSELCNSVQEISIATQIAKREHEEEQLRWEIQKEKIRIEEDQRRLAKNLKESKEELLTIIEAWAEEKRIEDFFGEALNSASKLSQDNYELINLRLIEARKMLGSVDALERLEKWRTPSERT